MILHNGACFFILSAVIVSTVCGLKKPINSLGASIEYQILATVFSSSIVVFCLIYTLTNLDYAPRYNLPFLPLAVPSYSVKPQNQEISGFNKHFYLVNFCQTEPDWDEQSSHFMQNSLQRVWQAKHPACPNIKACPPLSTMMVNLPCLWGSVSQLPSSHLFIHRVPAKLSNGVMLHGRNPCRLQLLFVL